MYVILVSYTLFAATRTRTTSYSYPASRIQRLLFRLKPGSWGCQYLRINPQRRRVFEVGYDQLRVRAVCRVRTRYTPFGIYCAAQESNIQIMSSCQRQGERIKGSMMPAELIHHYVRKYKYQIDIEIIYKRFLYLRTNCMYEQEEVPGIQR